MLSPGFGSGPFVPSSWAVAVSVIQFTPAGSGLATCTTNCTVLLVPAATLPTSYRYRLPLASVQPDGPTKVVLAGRVSVRTTPVASCVPELV